MGSHRSTCIADPIRRCEAAEGVNGVVSEPDQANDGSPVGRRMARTAEACAIALGRPLLDDAELQRIERVAHRADRRALTTRSAPSTG